MSTRVVGYMNGDRRRDRRREIVIEAMLDDQPIHILDIGLSMICAMPRPRNDPAGSVVPRAGSQERLSKLRHRVLSECRTEGWPSG